MYRARPRARARSSASIASPARSSARGPPWGGGRARGGGARPAGDPPPDGGRAEPAARERVHGVLRYRAMTTESIQVGVLLPTREAVMSGRFETAPLLALAERAAAAGPGRRPAPPARGGDVRAVRDRAAPRAGRARRGGRLRVALGGRLAPGPARS